MVHPVPEEPTTGLPSALRGVVSSVVGAIKLGLGVLAHITMVRIAGLAAIAVVGYALAGTPWFALVAVGLILGYLVYSSERDYRFAQKNPIAALLSGAHLFDLLKAQMGAKDESIMQKSELRTAPPRPVENQSLVVGNKPLAIEGKQDV